MRSVRGRRRSLLAALGVLTAGALTLGACATADAPAAIEVTETTAGGAVTTTPSAGAAAPSGDSSSSPADPSGANTAVLDIAAPLVGGGQLNLSTLSDRPVLLWFWAPF